MTVDSLFERACRRFGTYSAISFLVIIAIMNNVWKIATGIFLRKSLGFAGCGILMTGILLTQAEGATINAQSVLLADVTSAIDSASEGDTVVVPAGTASWTSGVTITKGITLRGANANPGDDLTVILDDVDRNTNSIQGTAIKVRVNAGQSFRLSGFTFRHGSITSPEGPNGIVSAGTITGPCRSFRIDHCHFDQLYQNNYLQVSGWIYGVVDHCIFDGRIGGADQSVLVIHALWGGGTNQYGDGSWADYPYYGTEKFVFIEDNTFNNPNPNNHTNMSNDCYGGGRYVTRHNVSNNCAFFGGDHGTESSGRLRGGRCNENYNNIINDTHSADNGGQIRGGCSLYHDNVVNGLYIPVKSITQYREFWTFEHWGATAGTPESPSLPADGTNPLDLNDTEGNGTNVPGHSPYLYLSGTHNGSNGSAVLVDTTKSWTTDQWIGYSITNTTQLVNLGDGFVGRYGSFVESNTANTITFHRDGTLGGPAMFFNAGDGYAIHKILRSLDQGAAGKGDLLAGAIPVNTALGNTVAWPRQALEPIYYWNNTGTSGMTISSNFPTFQENRDYFNLGNGFPANSTPSAVSAKFVAALNGVDYTGPYVYPHPLVNGVPPGAPQNLRVIP